MTKVYEIKPKTVGLMHKCKQCKRAVRTDCTFEGKAVDNEHPEHYLRRTSSYRRIVGSERWVEAAYFRFPAVPCPECGAALHGRAIEGCHNPKHPCDARCTGATGHDCECSCGGKNHGRDHSASAALLF